MKKKLKFRFGVKHMAFNAELRRRREERGLTQRELSNALGLSSSTIGHLETYRMYPTDYQRKAISIFFEVPENVIFPEWLSAFKLERSSYSTEHFITEKLLPQVVDTLSLSTGLEEVEKEIDQDFLKKEIKKVLSSLTKREAEILKLRFGFEEPTSHGGMTYNEIAKVFGVTRERVRQIEAKALRKLKHPSRRSNLKAYL